MRYSLYEIDQHGVVATTGWRPWWGARMVQRKASLDVDL